MRVFLLNQRHLPRPPPLFDLLLTRMRKSDAHMGLIPDQHGHAVFARKSRKFALAVLMHANDEIAGRARVERPKALAGQNIDPAPSFFQTCLQRSAPAVVGRNLRADVDIKFWFPKTGCATIFDARDAVFCCPEANRGLDAAPAQGHIRIRTVSTLSAEELDKYPSRERTTTASLEPRVSAVLVTRDTDRSLELSLRSALTDPWIDEVVIVDAGAPEDVSSALRALQADRRDVRLVTSASDCSLAAASNLGAGQARGRWLLFLDPHVVMQRGAAARLAASGGSAPSPWIAGGRLTDMAGRDRRAARRGALSPWSAIAIALNLPERGPKQRERDARNCGEPFPVGAVNGAFMLTPKHDFIKLGGFDEGFQTEAAALDLCRRATDAGGAVLHEPAAAGVQFSSPPKLWREAQGLARFAVRSARTPIEHLFAFFAGPTLAVLLALRDLIAGRPPQRK